jgi:hypothetical protein
LRYWRGAKRTVEEADTKIGSEWRFYREWYCNSATGDILVEGGEVKYYCSNEIIAKPPKTLEASVTVTER